MKKNVEKKLAEIIFCICGIMTFVAVFALFFSVGAMIEMWKITVAPLVISVFCFVWLVVVVKVIENARG